MSKNDFPVVMFKFLSYLYECLKCGVEPSMAKAKELCGCNDVYWDAVVRSALADGYVVGDPAETWGGARIWAEPPSLTLSGAEFVEENSRMREARSFLGAAFQELLAAAVKATMAL